MAALALILAFAGYARNERSSACFSEALLVPSSERNGHHFAHLPAGRSIFIRVGQTLDSASVRMGETLTGVVAADIIEDQVLAVPQGTPVSGRVVAVQDAAQFKGKSLLTIELTHMHVYGECIAVATDRFSKAGAYREKSTAEKLRVGASWGAILDGIFGDKAKAFIRKQQVQIPPGDLVDFRLTKPVSVMVD
ncbi:hypothetical protein PQR34_47125 [Paraburkholderia sediminicola]|uniref:hypothetical protein n=1 Tax=Paraburkholderia sediminicola TaxID=458836 RepID=UPI0038BC7CB0